MRLQIARITYSSKLRILATFLCGAASLVCILAPSSGVGQAEGPIEIVPPGRIVEGDRTEVLVRLSLADARNVPVLVTPTSEGGAVEVVRGRLLRADAENPLSSPLVFRIPILARSAGTAVIRVRISTYRCEDRCSPLELTASVTLRVERRPSGQ